MKGINREAPSLIYTHLTLTQVHMRERERQRRRIDSFEYFLLLGLFILWHSLFDCTILRKFAGFSPLWFSRWKYLCLVYLLYLIHLVYLLFFQINIVDHLIISKEKLTFDKEVFLGYAMNPLKKIVLKVIPTKRIDLGCCLPPHVPIVWIPLQLRGDVFNILVIVRYVMDVKVLFFFIDPCDALLFVSIKFG